MIEALRGDPNLSYQAMEVWGLAWLYYEMKYRQYFDELQPLWDELVKQRNLTPRLSKNIQKTKAPWIEDHDIELVSDVLCRAQDRINSHQFGEKYQFFYGIPATLELYLPAADG